MNTPALPAQVTDLMQFLDNSPCNFYAVANVAEKLDAAGFCRLDAADQWTLKQGGKYYMTKNGSAIFAFCVGTGDAHAGYKIISAHSDSPGFRIKPHAAMVCDGGIVKAQHRSVWWPDPLHMVRPSAIHSRSGDSARR